MEELRDHVAARLAHWQQRLGLTDWRIDLQLFEARNGDDQDALPGSLTADPQHHTGRLSMTGNFEPPLLDWIVVHALSGLLLLPIRQWIRGQPELGDAEAVAVRLAYFDLTQERAVQAITRGLIGGEPPPRVVGWFADQLYDEDENRTPPWVR